MNPKRMSSNKINFHLTRLRFMLAYVRFSLRRLQSKKVNYSGHKVLDQIRKTNSITDQIEHIKLKEQDLLSAIHLLTHEKHRPFFDI